MVGIVVAIISGVVIRVWKWRSQQTKAMEAVPATVCPVPEVPKHPSQGTVIATARQIWELEQKNADLRERLGNVDKEREELAADAVSLGGALAESERRAESLAADNATLRAALDGARLPVPVTRVDVVEVDSQPLEDKPTPTQGRARVRPR